jgi:hypothetical protein
LQDQPFSCGPREGDVDDKSRPKRRRKPQKPGKTAKQNDRHFVVHNYHDHSFDPDENDDEYEDDNGARRRGGVTISFPTKLHSVLEQVDADGWGHVISWQAHGRCFVIRKPKEFTDYVMPHYFRQSKLTSFQRQLNLYGFCRLTRGQDNGGYYHELFLRGRPGLAKKMQRTKIKGTKFKAASSPDQEPDFYRMPPVLPLLPSVSDDSSLEGSAVAMERRIQQEFSTSNDFFHTLPHPVSPSAVSIEPVNLQVPQTLFTPPMDNYPIMSTCGNAYNTIANNQVQVPFNMMQTRNRSQADRILDEAVDELFCDANNLVGLSQSSDFDQIWDNTEFGDESPEDDIELGFMLDKLLGN